ncbi:TusE/DsrC/DsvC family sulfur relay protein [Marinomonas atlantica]|uniref:TusE/DsrC/DsvC family sulfur relay protein n=1 Tax=Marinomonas atlantica TaxID=1806668 RepID=UPI00082F9BBB|nr:TusE/DsrC/DsvC family sulfur relay protein [Marinomonas atlantica]MCO4786267.1 TusE/DsrC/DsvC family sulfur relay protein [Marinomonas atlantica]
MTLSAKHFDEEGYLLNLCDWSEALAEEIATQEGLVLTAEHWAVLTVLRNFYQQFEVSPAMRPFVKAVAKELGAEKGKSIYLMKLFPGSPPKLAAKIAGLPKPANCL